MTSTTNMPGRKVPQGAYSAFVPAPLPPKFDWTPRLVQVLSEADRLIGKLAGEGGRLPNPHVLMRPFIRREAVLSSKIEGTQATLGELLAAEAGAWIAAQKIFGRSAITLSPWNTESRGSRNSRCACGSFVNCTRN